MGAWIEINRSNRTNGIWSVTPHKGVCGLKRHNPAIPECTRLGPVTPEVGVWIEILWIVTLPWLELSHRIGCAD